MAFKTQLIGGKRLQRKLEALHVETSKDIEQAIGACLLYVQNDARKSIQKGPKTGKTYRGAAIKRGRGSKRKIVGYGFHRASAPGEPPATNTGRLVSHINHEQDGLHGTVGIHELSQVKYARRLEFGGIDSRGVNIEARPFLFPAYEKNRKKIKKRLEKILPKALKDALNVG